MLRISEGRITEGSLYWKMSTYNPPSFSLCLDAKAEQPKTARGKVLVTLYNYKANPDAPGGFKELSIQKGKGEEIT